MVGLTPTSGHLNLWATLVFLALVVAAWRVIRRR